MKTISFQRQSENDLILVTVMVDNNPLTFAIDTGATHTIIDISQLLILGYEFENSAGEEFISTASGIETSRRFILKKIEFEGIRIENFEIRSLDLISNGCGFYFDGLLGLDFFRNSNICFNFKQNSISIG
jgi:predicted aspartyl protease